MTKTISDPVKSKKSSKTNSEQKALNEEGVIGDNVNAVKSGVLNEEDANSLSSVLTDEESDGLGQYSSGEDTDQLMAKALDTVVQQATEASVVIPPPTTGNAVIEPKTDQVIQETANETLKDDVDVIESDESSAPETSGGQKSVTRKIEVEKRRARKVKKLSRERRERIKNQVARQVLTLAAAAPPAALAQLQNVQATPQPKIPKLSSARLRQQGAVAEARSRSGLSSKYANLSKLVELHRLLLKGNPFSLIEPKQVYPHFHLIPGVNSVIMQPLIRAWQEKATRVLYQLLLVETIGDIARLKKRTLVLKCEPLTFADAFILKIDIGLENESDLPAALLDANQPEARNRISRADQQSGQHQLIEAGQPPSKKTKKLAATGSV